MCKSSEESFIELRQVQRRKFTTTGKAVLINGAAAVVQKMAGNGVDDHHIIAATCFNIFLLQLGTGAV